MGPYFVDRRRAGRPADAGARRGLPPCHERRRRRGAHAHDNRSRRGSRCPRSQHRAAVVGVRQLRHPVQGVRPEGRAARPVREDRRRRPGAPVHRRGAERRAAHPVGPGRRLRRPRQARGRPRRAHRRHQLQRVPGRRLHARLGDQPRPADPAQGHRPPARVRRHHGRDRVTRPQAVVLRRHQLSRPGRHRRPSGSPRRGTGRGVRAARRRSALPARVQAVRAGVLHDGRARLGHGVRALHRPRAEGAGRDRHRPPRAGHEHRVHRRRAAAGRASSAASTSTPASTPTTT